MTDDKGALKFPWYIRDIFNTELLEKKIKEWEEQAKEKDMTLKEYLESICGTNMGGEE